MKRKYGRPNCRRHVAPSLKEYQAFFILDGFKLIDARLFYQYYQTRNWHNTGGQPLMNWRPAETKWMKRPTARYSNMGIRSKKSQSQNRKVMPLILIVCS